MKKYQISDIRIYIGFYTNLSLKENYKISSLQTIKSINKQVSPISGQLMTFPYYVQIQNIDTKEKFNHPIKSHDYREVFNQKKQLNYQSIVEYILMYQPQCQKDMLLIMYLEGSNWVFMTSEFFIDLTNLQSKQQTFQKTRISKFGSKIFQTNSSQLQHNSSYSTKRTQKDKIILNVRFQCQLWVEDLQSYMDKSLINEQSIYSMREENNTNFSQKFDRIKKNIKEMEKLSHQLHSIEAESVGINIFWASPFFSTDGILRKPPKGFQKQKYELQKGKKQMLKNSIKCVPYVSVVTQQVLKSNKKIALNIDQFNNLSFARRNVFKIVYLICHTEVTQLKSRQLNGKRRKNESRQKDYKKYNQENQKHNQNINQNQKQNLHHIEQKKDDEQNQQEVDNHLILPEKIKFKKTQSFQIDLDGQDLENIIQQNQSECMTQRKPSQDTAYRKDSIDQDFKINLDYFNTEVEQSPSKTKQKSLMKRQQINFLEQAFQLKQDNNLFDIYQHQKFEYKKKKVERTKLHLSRISRSNSKKSVSSAQDKNERKSDLSKTKNNRKKQPSIQIKTQIERLLQAQKSETAQYNLNSSALQRIKKRYNKKQKKDFKKQIKKQFANEEKNNQKGQTQTLTYLVGENKTGELIKITPQYLDQMLSQKKIENIELLIFHTSYPYTHLPVLKKHANNIILINSNPMFPQACTIYFVKYFFKYLLQLKDIKQAFDKTVSQIAFLYRTQNSEYYSQKFSNFYSIQQHQIQKISFDPFMEMINKKHIHGGPHLCCCYHQHEFWCNFKSNKSTSKYADAHYKFHINRCKCHYENFMQHSCQQKKSTLKIINIIDKRKYSSKLVYDCCCLGLKLGKYKLRRKNLQYYQNNHQQMFEDPHSIVKKYILLQNSLKQQMLQKFVNSQLPELSRNQTQISKTKIDIPEGEVQSSYSLQFLSSLQYLSKNDLIGNRQLIVDLLGFFLDDDNFQAYNSTIKEQIDLKKSQTKNSNSSILASKIVSKIPNKMTNSLIKQSKIVSTSIIRNNKQIKELYSNQPKICNLHGQNSSGRKTISKYLAHSLIFKNLYNKLSIKYFTKVQDLKYIEKKEESTFYILIYKSIQRHQQINSSQITLSADKLPQGIHAIIVTNKKVIFEKGIKYIYETPKPFNKQQIQTYIKMYEHLEPNEKEKLKIFMNLTNVSDQNEDPQGQAKTKIYANRIDPFEIISTIRKSNYQNSKYEYYLEALSKVHIQSLPIYIFIAGIIHQTLSSPRLSYSSQVKQNHFIKNIQNLLKSFMTQSKLFYLFFDSKRNKNKIKNRQNSKILNDKKSEDDNKVQASQKLILDQTYKNSQITELADKLNKKSNQNQQQKLYKQQILKCSNISKFFLLGFQKFQKQISRRSIEPMRMFIFYTTLTHKNIFSAKQNQYSWFKSHSSCFQLQNSNKILRCRKVNYHEQFFQATSINNHSFISKVLKKQISQYSQYFSGYQKNNLKSNYGKRSTQQKQNESNQEIKEQINSQKGKQLINFAKKINQDVFQIQKESLNLFFQAYSQIIHHQNGNQQTQGYKNKKLSPKRLQQSQIKYKISQNINSPVKCPQIGSFYRTIKQTSSQSNKKRSQTQLSYESNKKSANFNKDQEHLHHIMQAGLFYVRNTICSHLTYNLLQHQDAIQMIKSALILINNALILMKTPFFQAQSQSFHLSIDQCSSQGDEQNTKVNQIQQRKSCNNQNGLQKKGKYMESKDLKASFNSKSVLMKQQLAKNPFSQMQKQIDKLFTIKGLLYLLFKIRQRCDGMTLIFTQKNSRQSLKNISKLSIIAELFTIQLHIMNLYKGQTTEDIIYILKGSEQKKTKRLAQIFCGKNKSINFLKQSLHFADLSTEDVQIIQNNILSAYILIATGCGRNKINKNLCQQINKMKNDLDQKAFRKDSASDLNIKNKVIEQSLSEKMRILLKISQTKDIFLKIYSIFRNFSFQKQQQFNHPQNKLHFSNKKSQQILKVPTSFERHNLSVGHQPQLQKRTSDQYFSHYTKSKLYKSEIDVYLKLLDLRYDIEIFIQTKDPQQLYKQLQKIYKFLRDQQIAKSLRFCSKYINDFYCQILQKTKQQIQRLKHRFILFLCADPIKTFKSSLNNSKKQFHQEYEDSINDKKRIQHEGKNNNIILGWDINDMNKLFKQKFHKRPSQTLNKKAQRGVQSKVTKDSYIEQTKTSEKQYSFFALKKKLNSHTFKQLSNSMGCKYLCIVTSNTVENFKNEVIGQSQQGQTLIYEREHLAQLIQATPTSVLFICLPKSNLVNDLKERKTKKQIVYFHFQRNKSFSSENLNKSESSKSQPHLSLYSSRKQVNQANQQLIYTYYRMIMQKVVSLILQKIVQSESSHSQTMILREAFNDVKNNYQFEIKNQYSEVVFTLSNQELKESLFFHKQFKLEQSQQIKKLRTITLFQEDIASADQIQEVKNILKHKRVPSRDPKNQVKIEVNVSSFQKMFKILKFYLKDKQSYEYFFEIDLQRFKFPYKQKQCLIQLKEKKSQESVLSVPFSLSRQQSKLSTTESEKKRKQKKYRQLIYQPIKYSDRWKSEFLKYLVSSNLLTFYLSNQKGLVMFLNSDLLNQKNGKEEWAKKKFDKLFQSQLQDCCQSLGRVINTLKISLGKQSQKKKQATLYFMQNKQ